jgi:NhaP-type Na+/H+ or K+/H+ antiporter
MEFASEITLAVGLMAVALHTSGLRFRQQWRSLLVMLAIVMPLMWAATSTLLVVILGLPLGTAALIGAILSPTDPVVANAIVTGDLAERAVPERIRNLISSESGANDGLAFPFVMLPVLLLDHSGNWALWTWLTTDVLWNVAGAIIFGIAFGWLAGVLFRWSSSRQSIDAVTRSAYPSALALVSLGAASLAQLDSLLAVYVAGLAFNFTVRQQEAPEDAYAHHLLDRLLTLPIFVLFGTYLPFYDWLNLGVAGIVALLAILLFRRLPAVLLLRRTIEPLHDLRDALFVGWFGPIGVAAMFYAVLAYRETGREDAWVIASLIIAGSIVVHGLTATPFTRLYHRERRSHDTMDLEHHRSTACRSERIDDDNRTANDPRPARH